MSSAHADPLAPLANNTNCSRGWLVENDNNEEGSSLSIDIGFMVNVLKLSNFLRNVKLVIVPKFTH